MGNDKNPVSGKFSVPSSKDMQSTYTARISSKGALADELNKIKKHTEEIEHYYSKAYNKILDLRHKLTKEIDKAGLSEEQVQEKLSLLMQQRYKKELDEYQRLSDARTEQHEKETMQMAHIELEAQRQVAAARSFMYSIAGNQDKIKFHEQTLADLDAEKQKILENSAIKAAEISKNASDEAAKQEQLAKLAIAAKADIAAIDKQQQKEKENILRLNNKISEQQTTQTKKDYENNIKYSTKWNHFRLSAIQDLTKKRIAAIDEEREATNKAYEEAIQRGDTLEAERLKGVSKDLINQRNAATLTNVAATVATTTVSKYDKYVAEISNSLSDYMGKVDSRLQGSGKNYLEMSNLVTSNLSISPFVQTSKVMEQLRQGAETGIAYNLEQRAFLNVIKDKIASTFDSFDSNLLRLIKIQQSDSTVARLGMEASLTKFYNRMYEDSQYLTQLFDTVSSTIIDASAQLTKEASTEFEYTVQKWLGSLSSVGVSDTAISNIASGLNMLGSGDVSGLASNSSLQTLLAMSAANSGLSYADLLLGGLNSQNTNALLASMVKYLRDVFSGSDNNVVKAAYGDIFNMSMSDMRAITNLSDAELNTIYNNSRNYSQLEQETKRQLSMVITRTTIPTMLQNLYDNAIYGIAQDTANNPIMFATNAMLEFMRNTNTDVIIPSVTAMGTGINLNGTTVQDILGIAMGGMAGISLMTNVLKGLASGGGMNLDSWNAKSAIGGGTFGFDIGQVLGGKSGTSYVSSGSQTDTTNQALSSAGQSAREQSSVVTGSSGKEKTFVDVINGSGEDAVRAVLTDSRNEFLNTEDGTLLVKDKALYDAIIKMSDKFQGKDNNSTNLGKQINNALMNNRFTTMNPFVDRNHVTMLDNAQSYEEYLVLGLLTGAFKLGVQNVDDKPLMVSMGLDNAAFETPTINDYIVR